MTPKGGGSHLRRLRVEDRGATHVEYVVALGAIGLVSIAALGALGSQIDKKTRCLAQSIASDSTDCGEGEIVGTVVGSAHQAPQSAVSPLGGPAADSQGAQAPALDQAALQARVDRRIDAWRAQLDLPPEVSVSVSIEPKLDLLASVVPEEGKTVFKMSFDRECLSRLSADELDAALAHEAGHMHVFTHFPFLQTEQLANQYAQRVVSRESLARLYEKMWATMEERGVKFERDLEKVLGPPADPK